MGFVELIEFIEFIAFVEFVELGCERTEGCSDLGCGLLGYKSFWPQVIGMDFIFAYSLIV